MKTIALDLEGTLIQDQLEPRPRPGLYQFLESCKAMGRPVMMTTVAEPTFRKIAENLVSDGHAPPWFKDIEYISWQRPYKDLRVIPDASLNSSILIDDYQPYIHPEQKKHWLAIETFFEQEQDVELARVSEIMQTLVAK